jgi:hypothetical protein
VKNASLSCFILFVALSNLEIEPQIGNVDVNVEFDRHKHQQCQEVMFFELTVTGSRLGSFVGFCENSNVLSGSVKEGNLFRN